MPPHHFYQLMQVGRARKTAIEGGGICVLRRVVFQSSELLSPTKHASEGGQVLNYGRGVDHSGADQFWDAFPCSNKKASAHSVCRDCPVHLVINYQDDMPWENACTFNLLKFL